MQYKPTGVCSQNIEFEIEDNKVNIFHFIVFNLKFDILGADSCWFVLHQCKSSCLEFSFVSCQKNYSRPVWEMPEGSFTCFLFTFVCQISSISVEKRQNLKWSCGLLLKVGQPLKIKESNGDQKSDTRECMRKIRRLVKKRM